MKPRVLHVAPFLWSGAGRVISRLAIDQSTGWDVAVATSGVSRGQRDWPAYRRHLATAGLVQHRIDFFDRDPSVYWRSVEALGRLVAEWHPDVVHTHAGVPACAAAVVRDASPRPFAHINHLYNWGVARPAWMNAMDLSGIRRADRVICSARAYEDLLQRHGVAQVKIRYIPWGLELDTIRAAARGAALRRRRGSPTVGFVGRIEPRKGQLDLIRAVARLRRRFPEIRLELVGPAADAAYLAEIRREIRGLGLGDAVMLAGHVRNPYRYITGWDLFVSLSSDEGQGLAVLEAMALSVPVLARRVAGVEDYLEDGVTGWVCPGVSAPSVADAMRRALRDPRRERIVACARARVDRRYSWPRTVEAIARLYGR